MRPMNTCRQYLDLTLEDESAVVDEYRALLRSNGYSV